MAVLLLIAEPQENVPYDNIDDVVGVFSDSHLFSDWELSRFDFMTVTGSREDVQVRLDQARPAIEEAYFDAESGEFTFIKPEILGVKIDVRSTLKPPIRWYQLNDNDKFIFKVGDLTQVEKDFISAPKFDINSSSADSYIDKFVKNLGRKTENTIEIKELRGKHHKWQTYIQR